MRYSPRLIKEGIRDSLDHEPPHLDGAHLSDSLLPIQQSCIGYLSQSQGVEAGILPGRGGPSACEALPDPTQGQLEHLLPLRRRPLLPLHLSSMPGPIPLQSGMRVEGVSGCALGKHTGQANVVIELC